MPSSPVTPEFNKPIKYAVAVILHDGRSQDRFLVVTRPKDDKDYAGGLGFPAASLEPGELVEEAAKRVCREKLGCEGIPTRFLGAMYQVRNNYNIFLMDVEVTLVGGKMPDVNQANTDRTAYVDQYWSDNPLDLMPSAQNGSCCSSIFLADKGLLSRSQWIESLEGSDIVG